MPDKSVAYMLDFEDKDEQNFSTLAVIMIVLLLKVLLIIMKNSVVEIDKSHISRFTQKFMFSYKRKLKID